MPAGRKLARERTRSTRCPELRTLRWENLTDLGHLQEYVEILAKTYAAIGEYNVLLKSPVASRLPSREWADWNLKLGTAIAMSAIPLLVSLKRPGVDVRADFQDTKYVTDCSTAT